MRRQISSNSGVGIENVVSDAVADASSDSENEGDVGEEDEDDDGDGDVEYGDDGDNDDDGDDGDDGDGDDEDDEKSRSVSVLSLDDSLVRSVVELGDASRQHSKNAGSHGIPNEKLLKEHP